jgi:8-oxo-dGTP diphosphatase
MAKDVIRVVAAVVEEQGRYLITQRNPSAVLPLMWEFPGGRVENGESEEQALIREVRWRINVTIDVVEKLGEHVHQYEHYDVHMAMYACRLPEGCLPRAVNVNDLRWVQSSQLGDYDFPPADEKTMDKLLGLKA